MSIIASSASGLSPLTRGTHMNVGSDRVFTRFIPAGAGNTASAAALRNRETVYPRWRGEHGHSPKQTQEVNGLSPLARGTPGFHLSKCWMWRFIPAGAGNTTPDIFATVVTPVYPRWRGEHRNQTQRANGVAGLSPLARGTLALFLSGESRHRFIPAGAGNTYFLSSHESR